MYHLEQEGFLRAWIQVQDQDIFVVGEDLGVGRSGAGKLGYTDGLGRILPRRSSHRVSAGFPYTGLSV